VHPLFASAHVVVLIRIALIAARGSGRARAVIIAAFAAGLAYGLVAIALGARELNQPYQMIDAATGVLCRGQCHSPGMVNATTGRAMLNNTLTSLRYAGIRAWQLVGWVSGASRYGRSAGTAPAA
jgi:hypothetical protein